MTDRSFDDYARFIRRSLPLVALVTIVAAVVGYAVSSTAPSRYRASSKLLVSGGNGGTVVANEDPTRVVETFVRLASSQAVLDYAARQAGISPARLARDTSVSGSLSADILTVTATTSTPGRAAFDANALASGFVRWRALGTRQQTRARVEFLSRQLRRLTRQSTPGAAAAASDVRTQLSQALAELQVPTEELVVISRATPPRTRFAPNPFRSAVLASIAGLLLGLALAAVREKLDRRLRSDSDLEEIYGAPILGRVPFVAAARKGDRTAAVADLLQSSVLANAFRTIRTNVALFRPGRGSAQVILVTSAMPDEGKTTVAANLARAFAVTGQRVLAVSADVHSPALHLLLSGDTPAPGALGIVEVLADDLPLERAIRPHQVVGPDGKTVTLSVVANEQRFPDPSILYQSNVMVRMLQEARRDFDVVILDAPPLLANAESALLGTSADGLVLVARAGALKRDEAAQAAKMLHSLGLRALGIIITGRASGDGAYGYGYGSAVSGSEPPGTERDGQRDPSSLWNMPRTVARARGRGR